MIHATVVGAIDCGKTINTNSYIPHYGYCIPYIILPFMQCEVHSGYYERPCSFIDQRLLASVPVIWKYETSLHHDQIRIAIVQEQALKYVPVQHHRKKILFHKLIRVIQMFMRTFSAIHKVFLTSNYY